MNHVTFESNKVPHLIEEYFSLSFNEKDIPYKSIILPIGLTHLFYVGIGTQKIFVNGDETILKDLMVTGQYFRSYHFSVNTITNSIGANIHPTALHKMLNIDVSELENKHTTLAKISPSFYNKLIPIFEDAKDVKELIKNLNSFFANTPLHINKNTQQIDHAISFIREKEGLLSVVDILDEISISQKTLETQFKIIVGITPGKYIRQYRFINLMKKHLSNEFAIKELVYRYNYYDFSHFSKDFKLFMNQDFNSFFKQEYSLIEKHLLK